MEGCMRKPRRFYVHREVWGIRDRSKKYERKRQTRALKNEVEEEEHLQTYGGLRKDRNENIFARPNGLRENAETAISCRGPGPARKNRRNNSREEEEDAQMCPYGKSVE